MGPINHLSAEMLCHVLSFCPPLDNVRNTQVCKNWKECASEVAKKQFITMREQEIESRSANFLAMVPEKLEFYCPSFKEKLAEIQSKLDECTIKEIYDLTQTLTERKRLCISKFFHVNAADPAIPENRRVRLADRAFVELHYREEVESWDRKPYSLRLWCETGNEQIHVITYLPIELFNLTLGAGHQILGEKNQGTFCFALRGRIVELTIEEGTEEIYSANWNGFPQLNRNNALTVPLTPEDATQGRIWAQTVYVAEVDAPKPTQE